MSDLSSYQKRKLWSLFAEASQGKYGVLYDEDHEYDKEFEQYITAVESVLSSTYQGEWAENTDSAPPNILAKVNNILDKALGDPDIVEAKSEAAAQITAYITAQLADQKQRLLEAIPEKKHIDWHKVAEKQGISAIKYQALVEEGYNQAISELREKIKGEA